MKPPPRKPGPRSRDRVSSTTKKPKKLSYRSPREARRARKQNAMSPTYSRPSHCLHTPPSFNLSFGSDLNDDLFSCVDKIDFDLVCSTPVAPVHKNHISQALAGGSTCTYAVKSKNTSFSYNMSACSLFDLSRSQVHENSKLKHTCAPTSPSSSFMTTPSKGCHENLKLSQWGIPKLVLEQYARRGITSMYKWQAECLMLPGVLQGGNLVFSAPTSAGKTFIAELLALKCVLETKKKVVIILPFVSIAHEKANYLQSIFEPNGVKVGGFMGNHSPSGGFAAVDIAICTIEKANSLVNRLLEEGSISGLGAVVVDELHMIGDQHRGYLLELLLTKLLYVCKKYRVSKQSCLASKGEENGCEMIDRNDGIQIVGMSATLPNLATLSNWLEGQLYCTDYRPVPLQEMVKVGKMLYDTNFKAIREISCSESVNDEEDILKLCEETVTNGHSVLIFCPTKQWCENLAGVIALAPFLHANTALPYNTESDNVLEGHGEKRGKHTKFTLDSGALIGVLEQLRRTQVGLDGILEKTVPCGVGFHHAGLTFDEREVIEGAFRRGVIRVLVATSTLSSGVNLPARLVIVRTPFFQRSLLDVLVYKQMVGRAGRKGEDERGESVLICKPCEKSKVTSLLQSAPKAVTSCLDQKREQRGKACDVSALRRALLEVITSGAATTQVEVETYLKCTLLFAEMNRKSPVKTSPNNDPSTVAKALVKSTAEYLLTNEFIALRNLPPPDCAETASPTQGGEYHATQLGAATVASALSPEEALVVFAEMRKARRNFVLESELHIIYLVTPVYIQEQWPSIDWYRFLCLLERLPADIKHVANTLGIKESFLASAIQGRIPERTTAQQERLRIHRRFFTALALHDLVHEAPIVYVARKYNASKGLLQMLQSAAGTFAGMVTVFCNHLGWKNLELLLSQFQSRLSFGVERELCDLVKISLLNGFRARALYNAGFHSLAALATANPSSIEQCLRNAVPFKSSKAAPTDGNNGVEDMQRQSTTWCAKLRRGMTEFEAAHEIVYEAQKILSEQMNVPMSAWKMIPQSAQLRTNAATPNHTHRLETDHKRMSESRQGMPRKSPNAQISNEKKRPCLAPLMNAGEGSTNVKENTGAGDEVFAFKTPKQRKGTGGTYLTKPVTTLCTSPIVASSNKAEYTNTLQPTAEQHVHVHKQSEAPLIQHDLPCVDAREDDSISYSPIFSPDMSANFQHSASHGLLCTPLPLEPFEPKCLVVTPSQSKMVVDMPSPHKTGSSNHLLTVPNSLPCSMDMSSSFSCATFAMIDAVCDGNGESPEGMSCSLISDVGEADRRNDREVVMIAESPAHFDDSCAVNKVDRDIAHGAISSPKYDHASYSNSNNQATKSMNQDILPCLPAAPVSNVHVSQAGLPPSQSRLKDLSLTCSSQVTLSQSGTCIIDVTSNHLLFQTFVSECLEHSSFSFSIALSNFNRDDAIGSKIVEPKTVLGIPAPHLNEQVVGVAICWGDMDVYYISLCKLAPGENEESIPLASRIGAICSIFKSKHCREVIAFSLKRHVKMLASVFGIVPAAQSLDPQVADWMLNPDGKEKTIHKMVLHYLPDQPLLSEGEDHEEMPLSNLATHGSEPHVRAAAECLLASLLISKMRSLLEEEALYKAFTEVEMPSLLVLTKMELNGIGFSKIECDALKQMLQLRLLQIEKEAYSLAQRSFSLTSPEDVAKVLFVELQLPVPSEHKQQKTLGPNRRGKKRIQHFSTAKDVLEKLKPLHPLPGLILEWRRVSSTVTKTVFPLCKDAVCHTALNSVRVHSTCHIHTATGRVATSDPNLQMVPKEYDIGSKTDIATMLNFKGSSVTDTCQLLSESKCFRDACSYTAHSKTDNHEESISELQPSQSSINMRSVFIPFPGGVFLAADYSQLELRVLAHMSGDSKLQKVLNSEGDVFKMIAGEWLGIPAAQVTAGDRQNAKQICYGMIYGIGPKALSEQLKIHPEDAARFMETFKSKYPAMKKFIATTVQSCRDNGYIVTLLGRKRFLSGIHSPNIHARSQAERQAVNSTIQGSAADLVKTAMINIDHVLAKEFKTSQPCLTLSEPSYAGTDKTERPANIRGVYLVLQLHDELLYEVCERDLPRVAEIVQYQMENALQLSVKFPVKVQTGPSWGNLMPYTPS